MGDKGKGKAEDLLIQKAVKEEKKKLKKRKAEPEHKRPLAMGAHQVTGQGPDRKKRALNPVIKRSPSSSRSPSPPHQPPAPLPFIALTDLDSNPALYQIPPVTASSTHADLLRAFSVSSFPSSDLSHLIPGTSPPDEDFSKAKPTNQVSITTFSSFLEPYFRPFNEEDLAFLRERGDRVTPFLIPKLGPHYEQAWREEDRNALGEDVNRPFVGARGAPGDITEEAVEREDISCGPLLSRLLAAYLPENESTSSPLESPTAAATPATPRTFATTLPGATPVPISPTPPAAGYTIPTIKSDYQTLDERIRREMIYVGLLDPNTELDFDNRCDDEVSARLRMLQKQLRDQVEVNTKRKEKIAEILKEQMAYQEYVTILEDLDKQVEQSFTKRSRSLNKPKKKKPTTASGKLNPSSSSSSNLQPSRVQVDIGEQARILLERRKRWIETIGPVFDGEIMAMPGKGRGVFDGLKEKDGKDKDKEVGVKRERER
ncbi:histone acetyltransferases subunit 3-domain-containing protein [Pyronema omphalodes]|nr:histone acetyltransferases subunit 3-domain-containing protein [Pyronema omphalodes]